MNIGLILHLAKIFALASVRAQRMKGSTPSGFAKSPKVNLIVAVVAFLGTAFLAFNFAGAVLEEPNPTVFLLQIAIFIPSLMTLASIMYGMLFEFSQSSAVGSSDIINWLPIHPTDFVIASVLSMFYFMSPLFGMLYGATLGLSLAANMLVVGLASIAVGTLGLFLGAFILEIIRAITNRVSSSFYKRSGRTTVAIRMFVFLLIFVAVMLGSNFNFLFLILDQLVGGIESAWFIPILWPSLTILSYLTAETLLMIAYAVLSIAFTVVLLWISVKLREKYWVPAPFSIKITSSKPYTPQKGLLGSLGFSGAESALIKKDFRGITRRKEMMVWVALPIGISVISIFSAQSNFATATGTLDRLMVLWGPIMGVLMLAFYMALTSIGQEGSAFMNLLIVPLNRKELVRAKLTPAILLSVFGMAILTILLQIIVQPRLETFIALAVTLFAVVFECAFVGLAVGSRFPDFTEVPRARFVSQSGVLLGLVIVGACVLGTVVPLVLYMFPLFGNFPILIAPVISVIVCALLCYISYHEALNSLQKLTQQA